MSKGPLKWLRDRIQSRRFYSKLHDDLPLLVRTEADAPITFKDEVVDFLKGKGWKPAEVPSIDPTLLKRLMRVKRSL